MAASCALPIESDNRPASDIQTSGTMLFCSQAYLLFFGAVFGLYWAMPWQRPRVWLLVGASFSFYACWNHWLAGLIAISTLIDYWLARAVDASPSARARKLLLTLSIVGNLGLLCYFKYVNFFLESLQATLEVLGIRAPMPLLSVILPVGISFYTFEAINYMVDVYRRKLPAERNLAHLMLFITFFPHLVAGPIVRARDFLPQVRRPKQWSWSRINLGVQLFLLGMFKKLAIADRMAAFVDPVYDQPGNFATHNIWLAVLAYALQIYGDFSGYTGMAIGSAHLLGYKLAPNFNMPYLAGNTSEFWRRWHISLSSWLRDYLFIPLGGSRYGRWQACRNLMITMTLAGLWHGASWCFVAFGVLNGLLLCGHRLYRDLLAAVPRWEWVVHNPIAHAVCVAMTFLAWSLTLVFFRAQSFADSAAVFQRLFAPFKGTAPTPVHATSILCAFVALGVGHWIGSQRRLRRDLVWAPPPVAGVGYAAFLSLTLLLAPASGKAFIYFQF
jgi:alginate O-acetyltransferase complex protein AlgI